MTSTYFKSLRAATMPMLFATCFTSISAAQSLVADWRFDEGGGAQILDSSGNGNRGSLSDAPHRPAWIPGRTGTALRFDGDDWARVPSAAVLKSPVVTLDAWVRHLGYPGASSQPVAYIAAQGGAFGCSSASYALYSRGGLNFYVSTDAGYVLSPDAGTGVWDGNWHHVAGSYDGAAVRLFVDGRQIGSGTPTSGPIRYNTLPSNDFLIGAYNDPRDFSCSYPFSGDIDQVRVWSRALAPCEIAGLFTASESKSAAATLNLIDSLANAGNFSILLDLIRQAGWEEALRKAAAVTVFAPNDTAFAGMPKGDLQALRSDPHKLAALLSRHVIRGRLSVAQLGSAEFPSSAITNLNGTQIQSLTMACHPGGCNFGGDVRIMRTDIESGNGLVHEIDHAMFRPIYIPSADLSLPFVF